MASSFRKKAGATPQGEARNGGRFMFVFRHQAWPTAGAGLQGSSGQCLDLSPESIVAEGLVLARGRGLAFLPSRPAERIPRTVSRGTRPEDGRRTTRSWDAE